MKAAPSIWIARILFTAAVGALMATIWTPDRIEWGLTATVFIVVGAALQGSTARPRKRPEVHG